MGQDIKLSKSLVRVREDKGFIRLEFSRAVSRQTWSCTQKYFALGLEANEDNYLLAEITALEIQQDIRAGKLDKSLESYRPESILRREVGIFYDPTEIKISLLELYQRFCAAIKPRLGMTTFEQRHDGHYLRGLKQCPQDLSDPAAIRDQLLNVRSSYHTANILNLLSEMIEWARETGLIHPDTKNSFKRLKRGIDSTPPPPKPPKLVRDSIPAYFHDYDIRGFTRQEAELIIEGFRLLAEEVPEIAYMYDYIRFLFLTGCRPGEASALFRDKVAPDFSYIVFDLSYDAQTTRSFKELKTAKDGTFARKFPCGVKLQALLREIREKYTYDDGLVFHNSKGNPVTYKNLYCHWAGDRRRSTLGIVTQLVKEGKIRQYLKLYATRATWINLQLEAEVPVAKVAKLAGNSPLVIYQHYQSVSAETPTVFEF